MIILFNKPYNVLCQFRPVAGRQTLKDFIVQPGVHAAGRLDADSEGLLLLTGDGVLQHRITDPAHKLPKIYYAQVEGIPNDAAINALRNGVMLNDGVTQPAEAERCDTPAWLWPRNPPIRVRKHLADSWLKLTLREGRNRQVRRMTAAVGHPTLRLVRYAIGTWTLADLPLGKNKIVL